MIPYAHRRNPLPKTVSPIRTAVIAGVAIGIILPILPQIIWAFTHRWLFPDILPSQWSMRSWRYIADPAIKVLPAALKSLQIAAGVTVMSVLVGVPAGRALGMYSFRGKTLVELIILSPALIPGLAVTMGMQVIFIRLRLTDTMLGVMLVHLLPTIPYMTVSMSGVFANYDAAFEEQAPQSWGRSAAEFSVYYASGDGAGDYYRGDVRVSYFLGAVYSYGCYRRGPGNNAAAAALQLRRFGRFSLNRGAEHYFCYSLHYYSRDYRPVFFAYRQGAGMIRITLRNVTKRYGASPAAAGAAGAAGSAGSAGSARAAGAVRAAAVDNLSLDIEAGELTAVLGPSGCGKTTMLKIIAGLQEADSGEILFNGQPVNDVRPEKRDAVMVFQNHLLFPYMNVEENIGFGLKMRRMEKAERRRRVRRMLSLVRLEGLGKRKPHQLSGGEKQRAALARALALRPGILLLDEPLSNLDVHLRDEMRELILRVHAEFGLTTVLVTHDQREAVQVADRTALMFEGRLHQFGRPEELYERPASLRIAAFFGSTNHIAGIKRGGAVSTAAGSFRVLNSSHVPDGPVQLLIRPEAIRPAAVQPTPPRPAALPPAEVSPAEVPPAEVPPDSGDNTFCAPVRRRIYMGTCTCCRIAMAGAGADWNVIGPPYSLDNCTEGQPAAFTLPADKIWLLPNP